MNVVNRQRVCIFTAIYLAFGRGARSRDSDVVVAATFVPRRVVLVAIATPVRENSRATNYLLGLSQVMDSPILPLCYRVQRYRVTLPYDVSTRACICKVEPNARGLKKKRTKKKK